MLAAACTPEAYKISIEVTKVTDPMTKEESYNVPEPYNREVNDDCKYVPPSVSVSVNSSGTIFATIREGSESIYGYSLFIDGEEQSGISISASGIVSGYKIEGWESSVKIMVSDKAGYTAVSEITLTPTKPKIDDNGS